MAKKKSRKEREGAKYSRGAAPAVQQGHKADADVAREAGASPAPSAAADGTGDDQSRGAASGQAHAAQSVEDRADARDKPQELYADVRAQREARRGPARKAGAADETPAGYVRRSSLYLAVSLALVAGLFVGSLLPGLAGHGLSGASGQSASGQGASGQGASGQGASAPAGDQPGQASPAAQDDPATRLAGHILELEEAVRKNPNDVAAWVQLGNLYFDSGKAPQSINAYERALLLKPDDANVLTDLGVMYREAGKYEQAVQSFRNASKVNPKHQNALFNRGVVLFFDLKRKEEGRKVWQELLVLNPQAKAPDGRALKDMLRDLK